MAMPDILSALTAMRAAFVGASGGGIFAKMKA